MFWYAFCGLSYPVSKELAMNDQTETDNLDGISAYDFSAIPARTISGTGVLDIKEKAELDGTTEDVAMEAQMKIHHQGKYSSEAPKAIPWLCNPRILVAAIVAANDALHIGEGVSLWYYIETYTEKDDGKHIKTLKDVIASFGNLGKECAQ